MFSALFLSLFPIVGQPSTTGTDSVATSQENLPDSIVSSIIMPQIDVIDRSTKNLRRTPGSAIFLNEKQIQAVAPISGNEVFRRVAGVHVVDEEGAGLRANIGIRGLDPSRSSSVLVLEDGIPVALNPYGEPELYYTPNMDRMAGLEIVKGSGQILFGPQTIGGVVNYITPEPTQEETFRLNTRAGQGGFFSASMLYSNTYGNTGVLFSYQRKQADQVGYVGFSVDDFMAKLRFKINENSHVGVKASFYNEISDATYLGLTQTMYDAGGQDFVKMAPMDRLPIRRYSLSATHVYKIHNNLNIKTTAFGYTTTRNWRRQDFLMNIKDGELAGPPSNHTGVTWGDPSVPGGAVYMRNSNDQRNRQFEVAGVESRLTWNLMSGSVGHSIEAGARFQFERAFEQRVKASIADGLSGDLVNEEIRTGRAMSVFVHDRIFFGEKFQIIPGVRMENYDFDRHIVRNASNDTSIRGGDFISQIIPGVGFNYNLFDNTTIFGGVHRGFAPPRLKDAITEEGETQELDAELSWNNELGFRTAIGENLYLEFTGFYMDFENQIISVAEAAGGTGSDLVNGGRTQHTGVEFAINYNLLGKFSRNHKLWVNNNSTFVHSVFGADRFKEVNGDVVNFNGNRLPYAPQLMLGNGLTYEYKGLMVNLHHTFVSDQFTDVENSITPSADGREGRIDAYQIFDASVSYRLNRQWLFSLSVKNITNERFIASRRPQGIRLGLPRFISGGVTFDL